MKNSYQTRMSSFDCLLFC